MIPDVPRDTILDAMARFDAELRDSPEWADWERRPGYKFAIEEQGRRYPIKQVLSMATDAPVSTFSGGEEANGYARQRGFQVVQLRENEAPAERRVWWVNQGTSLRAERESGTIWAPHQNRRGQRQYHWETLAEVSPGDIILHYAEGALRYVSQVQHAAVDATRPGQRWGAEGREVRTRYYALAPPVPLTAFSSSVQALHLRQGPLDATGGVKQGYLFRFSEKGLRLIQEAHRQTKWPDFAEPGADLPATADGSEGGPPPLQVRSWSRPRGLPGLLGRKRMDWSTFLSGTHVPLALQGGFDRANGGEPIPQGSGHSLELLVGDRRYDARLQNVARRGKASDSYELHWRSRDLVELLRHELATSYQYMVSQQASLPEGTRMSSDVPDHLAEFMDFYATDTPYVYRVELIPHQERRPPMSWRESIASLVTTVESTGFTFEPWQIAAYVTALRTKPFVILAGVSGTGKSKLPKLVADATGGTARLIPVRPDWTDSSEVLGYVDLRGDFRPGRLLEVASEASAHPELHYVAIIDEMNLARVEHYFAEVLSGIEDRRAVNGGGYESCPLLNVTLGDKDADWREQCLPANLAIVGTVNMDESAHGFSRKVLDRAFTLEFSDIDLSAWQSALASSLAPEQWPAQFWYPRAIQLGGLRDLTAAESALVGQVVDVLTQVNERLLQAQLQVGYRTRDEMALFRLHAQELLPHFVTKAGEAMDPLDLSLLMKVLPRIVGGSMAIRRVLLQLVAWAMGEQTQASDDIISAIQPWLDGGRPASLREARYPRTAARLCLMLDRLQSEGYTSFWL